MFTVIVNIIKIEIIIVIKKLIIFDIRNNDNNDFCDSDKFLY